MNFTKPYAVGITGGSGSGKTYFLKRIISELGEKNICFVSQDNYYKDRNEQPLDTNGIHNYDTPESIDLPQFAEDVSKLIRGVTVQRKEYTYNNPNTVPKILTFEPKPIMLVEGLFIYHCEKVRNILDLKIFVEAKYHIKMKRRIKRDNIERGYDLHDVLYRYEEHVVPAFEKYVAPHKDYVDLIVPNNTKCDTALSVVISHLRTKML
jgi:uridine kinase